MKQVRRHNNILTHCTIFINHIILKSPVSKKKKNTHTHLRNKSENTTIFLTHCTIFINHIFLKSPVAKSEKRKKKKRKVNQLKLASVCVHPKSLLQFAGHPKSRAHTQSLSLSLSLSAAAAKAKDNSRRRRGRGTPTRLVHKYISFFTHVVVYFFLYFFLTKYISKQKAYLLLFQFGIHARYQIQLLLGFYFFYF